jgi:DNA invertase Pin-like site-specific DNA recombinase
MGKTCVVYCRTSTAKQKENDTIGAQVERCRLLIERHGLTPLPGYGPKGDGWLRDDGVSGSLLDGRSMGQLLDDLEAKRIKPDYLLTYSLSRVSRVDRTSKRAGKITESHVAAARIQGVLISSGVSVLDEDGVLDPSSLQFAIKSMLANEEYKVIRGRTMSGKSRHLGEGHYSRGGRPPFGYEQIFTNGIDRKQSFTLVPSPHDAQHLEQILEWFVEGGLTYAARKATEAGIRTPMAATDNRKNKAKDWTPTRWSPVTIQHIVRNAAAYLGSSTFIFDGEPYTINFPPLITPTFYAKILKRQKERTLKKRATMLTTGFCSCTCGAHIHAIASHKKHKTSCRNKCGSMLHTDFEKFVYAVMVFRLGQILADEGSKDAGSEDDRIELLTAQVSDYAQRIQELIGLYQERAITKDDWRTQNTALQEARARAQHELDQATNDRKLAKQKAANEASLAQRVTDIIREFTVGHPSFERKREVLRDILGGERAIVGWTPKGVTLTLPAFGSLPPTTIKQWEEVWRQMVGLDP